MMRDEYAMRDGSGNVEGGEAKRKTGGTGVDLRDTLSGLPRGVSTLGVHEAPR